MNKLLTVIVCATATATTLFVAQPAPAGPIHDAVDTTTNVVRTTGRTIDNHIIKPARRTIAHHMPRSHAHHRAS